MARRLLFFPRPTQRNKQRRGERRREEEEGKEGGERQNFLTLETKNGVVDHSFLHFTTHNCEWPHNGQRVVVRAMGCGNNSTKCGICAAVGSICGCSYSSQLPLWMLKTHCESFGLYSPRMMLRTFVRNTLYFESGIYSIARHINVS